MLSDINIKGTNHKIGGDIADGQWVSKSATVFSGLKWTATGTYQYTVQDYLPDDTYTYEVRVMCYATTGNVSGDSCAWWVREAVNNDFSQVMGYGRTRTNSYTVSGNSGILPLKQENGVLTLEVSVTNIGSAGTNNNGLYLSGYRRLGGVPIPVVYYTLTINPTPADATVTFSTGTVSGNSCTVADGTSVTYTVSKSGYTTQTGTVTVNADQTVNVTLLQITGIPMYGYNNSDDGDGYLLGSNSVNGVGMAVKFPSITAKSGNIGASGSTITVNGRSHSYYSTGNFSVGGQTLYCYQGYQSGTYYYIYVISTAGVGKKAIEGINGFLSVLGNPASWSSSSVEMGTGIITITWNRKSSIDTTFTGE